MQSTTKTVRLLCLTDASADSETLDSKISLDESDVDIALSSSLDGALAHLERHRVDCLLCTHRADIDALVSAIRTLRSSFPAVPLVVFTDDEPSEYVDAVIEAGATEVVQSTAESVSEPLLRRRIESVVDADSLRSAHDRSLERYETILNTAVDAIYQLDTDGTIIAVNDAAVELTGYDRSELIGSPVGIALSDEDIQRGNEQVARTLTEGEDDVQTLEMTVQTKDGREIPCETRIAVLRRGGRFDGTVGVIRDISEQRERERKLSERDQLLQQISENINDVVWMTPPEKNEMVFVSAAYEDIWGRSQEALYENPNAFVEGIHPDDREAVEAALERQQTDPESYDETYRVVQPDGEIRWVHDRAFGVYEDGELTRLVGVVQDITERRQTQQELWTERDMFAEGPAVMFKWDNDEGWPVEYVSENVEDIFGYTPKQLISGEVPYADIVHDDDLSRVADEVAEASESGADRFTHEPYRIVTSDGDVRWVTDTTKIIRDGETVEYYQGYLVDITERKRREQKVQQQRDELAQLDRLNSVIRDVDQALVGASSREEIEQFVCEELTKADRYDFALALRRTPEHTLESSAWTGAGEEYATTAFPIEDAGPETSPGLRALETGEVQVLERISEDPTESWEQAAMAVGIESLAAIPVTHNHSEYGVIAVYAREPDAFNEREIEVLGELGETIGYAIAAVERREREETLTSLYEATRALLGTTTEQGVSEVVIDVAADVLDLPGVAIFLFDDEENVLRPMAATETIREFYGEPIVFGPGRAESTTWHSYATGESKVFDDIRNSERIANPDTDARSTLMLPLGDHGVFVAASADVGIFDEQKRRLVGLLAATTEAALDRVAGQEGIRELDEALAERTRELEQSERINDITRDVADSVIRLSAREDIEQAVCDRLVADDRYAFAWIGSIPPDETLVEPRTWAGGSKYLDAVSPGLGSSEPSARAVDEGEVVVVDNITDHLRESPWARAASDLGYQSVLSVPLTYGEATYGVLSVYATEPSAFDETVSDVFADIGRLVGYGLSVAETERGILSQEVTELELDIETPNTFLSAVAELTGQHVEYRETTPDSDGTTRVLFELADPPVDDVLALKEEFVAVDSLTHVERGDQHTFRALLNGETVSGTLLESGGIPQRVVATGDRTQATVRLPRQQSVRAFLERVRETYPETDLASKRERQRADTSEPMQFALDTELTDRQREVLVTAYESGFFQSPRETTGAELADLLEVSQPTVTHHLREAQRRLFEELFDGQSSPDSR